MANKKSEINTSIVQEVLLKIPKFGNGVGLHRMLALCNSLANSQWMKQLDAIKITGSNGKGSVSAMVSNILRELGFSVGLYTSPHLVKFNERIMVNGVPISDSELSSAVQWFHKQRDNYQRRFPNDTIGAFEAFTAIALNYFSVKQPQVLVTEAGIGGRYDSTRIIPGQIIGLTSVDLEHTALLGPTIELIAYDKADLCPESGSIITGISDQDILRRLKAYCTLRGVTLHSVVDYSFAHRVSFGETHMELDLDVNGLNLTGLKVGLQGVHQVTNVMVAVSILQEWLKFHQPEISEERFKEAIHRGMHSLRWKGRFERIHQNPDVFIDVGHTPDAIASLVKTVGSALGDKRILLVTGVSYDKEIESIIKELVVIADAVICTQAYHKGSPPDEILKIVQDTSQDIPAFAESNIDKAMQRAIEYASENGMTVLVAGGLFLAIEAMQALNGENPQDLRFF